MDNHAMADIVDGHTLVFVREVPHAPERVWKAISDESELMAWMRYPVSFSAKAAASVDFFGPATSSVTCSSPTRRARSPSVSGARRTPRKR